MKIDHAAIEATLPTSVDELMWQLESLRAPLHITAGNRQLRAELGDVDDSDLSAAVRIRKQALCQACATGQGRHSEPQGARVGEFTPGVRPGR
ncbi:hypothetical protein [Streptomyces soliscabiei]|uniref:hypothetical protein n=1 Tax=Streptomyces soliscabiei TaxID=588897 RepID=UPI0029BCEF3C|nr:hypothetical protein [Streptomyces sp. NY05-11A]MDX2676182.1 hypothetical protein [Streptomyces sp. NY05-11A]